MQVRKTHPIVSPRKKKAYNSFTGKETALALTQLKKFQAYWRMQCQKENVLAL